MKQPIALLMAAALVACAPKPKPSTSAADEKVNGPEVVQADDGRAVEPYLQEFDADEAPVWRFYFDLDSPHLRETATVARLAQFLKGTKRAVVLTGNASTEGANDYNLALGLRRAENVRAYLLAAGVRAAAVTTKSLGEEAPVALEPNLEHLNRRVDAVLEAP